MFFIVIKGKLNAPLSLIFSLCLGQVKWHCKAHVNTFSILIKVLGSGAFQELQYSLEKSTIPAVSVSAFFLQQLFQMDILTYRLSLAFAFRS